MAAMKAACLALAAGSVVACSVPPPELRRCDIREPDCQTEVFLALHELRGQLWDPWIAPPPVEVLPLDVYAGRVIREVPQSSDSAGDWSNILRGLGLLPPGVRLED